MNLTRAFCHESFIGKEIFKFDGIFSHSNMTGNPSISVKICHKSLLRKGFQLQMGKTPFVKNGIRMERCISAVRFDFVEAVLPGCGDFRKSPRAYDALLEKASRCDVDTMHRESYNRGNSLLSREERCD